MIPFALLTFLLQIPIDPAPAVENVSLNYGLLGSLFVIVLVLLIGAMAYIKATSKKQFEYLNMRLDKAEKEAKEARDEATKTREDFLRYVQDKNEAFAEVIKEYAHTRDKSSLLMEKLLARA